MRPIPLPEGWVDRAFAGEDVEVVTMAAPNGDLTDPDIAPVEAVRRLSLLESGARVPSVSVLWILEEGDAEALAAGGAILFTSLGGLPPHDMRTVQL